MYARCRALIFPGEEDFGIVPLEAQACGCPVIAFGRGGALETVVDLGSRREPTGVYFHEPRAESLVEAILLFERQAGVFDPRRLRAHALAFGRERCKAALRDYVLGGAGRAAKK